MVRNTLSGDPLLPFEMVEGVEQGMLIDGMEALLDRFKVLDFYFFLFLILFLILKKYFYLFKRKSFFLGHFS